MSDLGQAVSCKIGTVPKVLYALDRRIPVRVGAVIRYKECRNDRWHTAIVREVQDNGYFFADCF